MKCAAFEAYGNLFYTEDNVVLTRNFSVSAVIAGLLAVIISYAGPLVIVFQAAKSAGLSDALTSSWIWAISIGSGLTGAILSWKLKAPVVTAWSTPGAALLVVMLPTMSMNEAVAGYIVAALMTLIVGVSGLFARFVEHIPKGIAAAMLAGILLHFGMDFFRLIPANPVLVLTMIATFIAFKRIAPRYAIAAVLLVGTAVACVSGLAHMSGVSLQIARPVFIRPEWSWHAIFGLSVPLFLVTITGQYVPGLAVLRASGYSTSVNPIVSVTGLAALLLAPFGAHSINLAAITAAICCGEEAHENPSKRYVAGIVCGVGYLVIGTFGAALAGLFSSLPKELIATLAGLALVGSILTGMIGLTSDERHRDSSVITFLVAASGMSFLGLGAAFWSLVFGGLAYFILHTEWNQSRAEGLADSPSQR
jgi:benzoate membrane transport protein